MKRLWSNGHVECFQEALPRREDECPSMSLTVVKETAVEGNEGFEVSRTF